MKSSARRRRGRPTREGEARPGAPPPGSGGAAAVPGALPEQHPEPSLLRWGSRTSCGLTPASHGPVSELTLGPHGPQGPGLVWGAACSPRCSLPTPLCWYLCQRQRVGGRLCLVGGGVGVEASSPGPRHTASTPLCGRRPSSGFQTTGWLCRVCGQLLLRGSCGCPGCPQALSCWAHRGVRAFPTESG